MIAPRATRRITMASGSVGVRRRPGSFGDLVLGSWPRTLAASVLIALVAVVGVWAYASGALTNLRYASFPGHPYPPAGYYQNPFNPKDRGDLINEADARRVKADLLRDGDIELQAVASGSEAALAQADSGNRLARLQQVVHDYNAAGLTVRQETHFDSLLVGRLADPNSPAVTWCVQEKGKATITYVAKSTGQTTRQESFSFTDKYWLIRSGDHYLIVDAEINNQPASGA
jgi:hypothetical protein